VATPAIETRDLEKTYPTGVRRWRIASCLLSRARSSGTGAVLVERRDLQTP